MNDREKLIRDATKALFADESTEHLNPKTAPEIWAGCEQYARITLAVFEKAHTPTDDEREALTLIVRDVHNYDGRPGHLALHGADAGRIADAILASGFRRSEVPEPSAEHAKVWDAGFFKGWLDRHAARPDEDGKFGPTLPLPNPYGNVQHSMACDVCGALTFDSARFGAAHEAKADGRGCPGMFTTPRKDVGPQREPSEAQIDAAMRTLDPREQITRAGMRAALRAASEVGGEGR